MTMVPTCSRDFASTDRVVIRGVVFHEPFKCSAKLGYMKQCLDGVFITTEHRALGAYVEACCNCGASPLEVKRVASALSECPRRLKRGNYGPRWSISKRAAEEAILALREAWRYKLERDL